MCLFVFIFAEIVVHNTGRYNLITILIFNLLIQVYIKADLEKKIIKLINDFRQENADKGPISGRLTTKKLLVKIQI